MQAGKGRIQGCNNVRYKDLQAGKGGGVDTGVCKKIRKGGIPVYPTSPIQRG